jgi:hypothetical protein
LLALEGSAPAALAQTPPATRAEPFRLVWSSSAGCGEAREFVTELEGRTALLREARPNEHAITLIVETFRAPGGVRGQLTVRKPDGDLSVREVPGQNCQEVESAMALIAALMVDPLAAGLERGNARPHLRPPPEPRAAPTRPAPDWSWRIEQRLTARTAIAPGATWGQALGVMATRETSKPRPSLAVSVHSARATTSAPEGSAELTWTAAQLSLCPFGLRPGPSWDVRACGAFQIGRLRGAGFRTASPAAKAILWSSAGLALEGRYELVGPLWIGWEGAFTFPFTRERFYLLPEHTLHRVPAWGVNAGLGVGLRFF